MKLNRSSQNTYSLTAPLERNYTFDYSYDNTYQGGRISTDSTAITTAYTTSNINYLTASSGGDILGSALSLDSYLTPHKILSNEFAKKTRKLSNEAFMTLLETIKEDDYDEYIDSLGNIISHPDFRKLSDQMLTELIKDLEVLSGKGIDVEDYYILDDYDQYKVLKKLR